jgi:hypothetical protein
MGRDYGLVPQYLLSTRDLAIVLGSWGSEKEMQRVLPEDL